MTRYKIGYRQRVVRPYKMWRACGRKRLRYEHEGQARREAHKRNMIAYKCEFCGKWHLATKKNKGE